LPIQADLQVLVTHTTVDIRGSLAVVTGASGGLGGAIARVLDQRGARVILTGRRVDALNALAAELTHAEGWACDLADRNQLEELLGRLADVDILIANAALPGAGKLEEFTTAELDRALDVNLRAPMLLVTAVLAHLMPGTYARLAQRAGADKQTASLAAGLRHKR
jgi:NADP-dependent 3-hydroxy acid dehydrogenase YdfG